MAFSESFGLGNSTFMDLESEVNKALQVNARNPTNSARAPKPKANPLDIIDESPTNSKGKPNKSRSRHHASVQRRRKFQKSKSDSTLDQNPRGESSYVSKHDIYSEFFKSEFSIAEDRSIKSVTSLVSTSRIEAAVKQISDPDQQSEGASVHFGFEDSKMFSEMIGDLRTQFYNSVHEENMADALDVPVFSEDVQKLLNDSSPKMGQSFKVTELYDNEWKDTLELPESQEGAVYALGNVNASAKGEMERPEEVFNIDDATFICPDEEGRDFAEQTINEVKIEVQDALQEEQNREVSTKGNTLNASTMERSGVLNETRSKDRPSTTTSSVEPYEIKRDLEELKRISAWNLPSSVLKEYEKKGISKMFDWQIECLSNPKVLFEHCNLVYSAPTSAGKTLVSEILLIKTILERGKKVIVILPFISVVREKMFYLQDLLTPSGYRVEGFFGGYTPPGGFDSINVAICTIEKANSIVNKLLEHGKLDEIGTVVVDEIHLISDPGRGYILELLLAKVLYMSRKYALQIQIITMSATLANVELLKKWLDAELYITDYRPVALQEMIKIGTKIYDSKLEFIREISAYEFGAISDQDHVAQLCIETITEGCSVVVFCPSKDWCENLSVQLAAAIHAMGRSGSEIGNRLRGSIKRDPIEEVKKQLKDIPTGLDSVLEKTINYGCAFHHAGLTTEERDIIEACFKSGALKIIVATSTLSSGVNLPARRVIIRSPLFGGKQMSSLTYKQMIGRAGRTGKDTLGESILICTDSNARIGKDLVCAALNPICSCLEMESSTHLKRALLEVIASSVATTKTDILNFVQCTLLNTQKEIAALEKNDGKEESPNQSFIFDSIDFLIEYEFIRLQRDEETDEDNYVATRLGMACLASSMPPTDGLILFSELQKSRRCFVLESELHAVYLVTPYSVCYQLQDLDWLMYLDLWEKLSPAMKKVGELVGVKESFLVRAMRGQIKLDYKLMQIHKRFYTALALQELVNETPVNTVAAKFKCTRGMLQSLQQMASTFAGIVTAFCNSLNWSMLSLIVGQFKERLFFGVHRDLIDLMRLPDLNYKRARALFDGGIENLIGLANAYAFTVEKILHNSMSFDTAKQLENEDEFEKNQRNNMRNLYITGKAGLTVKEAAKMLVDDARQFMQYEIGVDNINWSQEKGKDRPQDESGRLHMPCEGGSSKRKSKMDNNDVSPPKIMKDADGNRNQEATTNSGAGKLIYHEDDEHHVRENANSSVGNRIQRSRGTSTLIIEPVGTSSKPITSAEKQSIQRVQSKNKYSSSPNSSPIQGTKQVDACPTEFRGNGRHTQEIESGIRTHRNRNSNSVDSKRSDEANSKDVNAVSDEFKETVSKSNGTRSIQQVRSVNGSKGNTNSVVRNQIRLDKDVDSKATQRPRSNQNDIEPRNIIQQTKDLNSMDTSAGSTDSSKLDGKSTKQRVIKGNHLPAKQRNEAEFTEKGSRNSGEIKSSSTNRESAELREKARNMPSCSKNSAENILKENRVPSVIVAAGKKNINSARLQSTNPNAHRPKEALQIKYQGKSNEIVFNPGSAKESHTDSHKEATKQSKAVQPKENIVRQDQQSESALVPRHNKENRSEMGPQKPSSSHENIKQSIQPSHQLKTETNASRGSEERQQKPKSSPSVRRSPRNHMPSLTRIEKPTVSGMAPLPPPNNDLFMDDTSFEMNSEIANAMEANNKVEGQPPRRSLNKSSDEIAASQEMTFEPKTQSTRFLRSYREQTKNTTKTPPRRTPLQRRSEIDPSPAPAPVNSPPPPPAQSNKSSTMEVSDISLGNSLIQNPIQLNASHILSTSKTEPDALSLDAIQIVDICGSQMLFKNAIKELTEAKLLGFSVGVEKQSSKRKPLIGANLLISQVGVKETATDAELDFFIDDTLYVAGISMVMSENVSFFFNLQAENTAKGVNREMKIEAVRKLVENTALTLQIFDCKEQLKVLRKAIPSIEGIRCKVEDPKVANWLLQPDKTMSFANMAQQFAPECKALVNLAGSGRGYGSIGLDSNSAIFGKIRSSIEACVTMHILKGQVENLERIGTGQLHKFFIDLEMPLQLSLCDMEIYGFPANEAALRSLFQQMMDAMKKLEAKIYESHGSRFNLGSGSAVARVVGLHRKANGRVSTSKQILEKIDSPIALMIVSYRKLSVTLAKTIQPLLRSIVENRIRGQSITFTSTGRISMQEPNLQNVAKDFEVVITATEKIHISCRSSFFPPSGRYLVAADFCQLEMRILAHLSQDPPLLQVMKSDRDLFTAIAAKWNKIPEDSVSEQLRNGTKQICYGIVYGMGMRSLAESLKCSEQEAMTVSEQFHAAYPGIRSYAEKVMKFARQHEYVETITGRRRYLDNISSGEPQLRSQAERQAVNSTIQGSAADIAKSAILRMEKNITKYQDKMGLAGNCVNLVLHLHDELIFEVPEDKAKKVAKVLSITMENCVRLSVPLKVKLKIGKSWADLKEVKL